MGKSINLIFGGISEVVGGNGIAVIMLTDRDKRYAVSVVCDDMMKRQISMRNMPDGSRDRLLPEVMSKMLHDISDGGMAYRIDIDDISDGEYKTAITDMKTLRRYDIRLSDAVLLSLVSDIPIYMDEQLMKRQASPYRENADRMAIPLNTLDAGRLKEELDKAVAAENYRLAALIKEELDNRRKDC